MAIHIQIRRGLRADLPSTGLSAEPFFCTDTGELFVWDGFEMVAITGGTGAIRVFGEVPSGSVNGINTDFVLAHTPNSGTLRLYKNGMRLTIGGDYSLSLATVTFISGIPKAGDILLADYEH